MSIDHARERQGDGWGEEEKTVTVTVQLHNRTGKEVQVSLPGDIANPRVVLPRREVVLIMNRPTYRLTLPLSMAIKHRLVATATEEEK